MYDISKKCTYILFLLIDQLIISELNHLYLLFLISHFGISASEMT